MPSPHNNQYQTQGLYYGAAIARGNVEFAEDSSIEAMVLAQPGKRDTALLDRLKDALRPGDARRRSADDAHDGRHGGIEEVMQPGHRDYDEREEMHQHQHQQQQNPRGGLLDGLGERRPAPAEQRRRRSSILDTLEFGTPQMRGDEPTKPTPTSGGGVMDAVRRNSESSTGSGGGSGSGSGRNDKYRDSSHVKKTDEHLLPGGMYRSLRDDFWK
ncbi:hypothetical protein F4808DRAFT_458818 [Astrocystis sublimbata]|nr:hypothetical protein F4808DRAFT_458818 [Astrocystis sublimbata]